MIVKMKFLSITGPKADIDRVVSEYLSKYEIHLENALSELKDVKNLKPYMEINPYREWLAKAEEYVQLLPDQTEAPEASMSPDEAVRLLEALDKEMDVVRKRRTELENKWPKLKKPCIISSPLQALTTTSTGYFSSGSSNTGSAGCKRLL